MISGLPEKRWKLCAVFYGAMVIELFEEMFILKFLVGQDRTARPHQMCKYRRDHG